MELKDQEMTSAVIRCGIAVHKSLGPGFLECIYEKALAIEFEASGIPFVQQAPIDISYREQVVGEHRLDFLVGGTMVLELKAIKALDDIHFAVVRSYMKATGATHGMLMNFAEMPLRIKRVGAARADVRGVDPNLPDFLIS